MSHISLYRKYRPTNFSKIIGQEYVVKSLCNSIVNEKVGHAYIFNGSRGCGKTSIAKIFAKAANCLTPINGDACNKCENCQFINNLQTVDVQEIDAASHNGVEEIRKINESVNFLPVGLKKKIYIIDEAHMLTTQSWNALLKTIEEPPEYVIFIFATTEIHKVPATIISRCQRFQFNKLSVEQIIQVIKEVCTEEKISIEEQAVEKIAALADGGMRDALSMLEQVANLTNSDIKLNDVNEVFGLIDTQNIINFLKDIIKNDITHALTALNGYVMKGCNLLIFVENLINLLIDKAVALKENKKVDNEIDLSFEQVIKLLTVWQNQYVNVKTSNDTKFYVEMGIFESIDRLNNNDSSVVKTEVQEVKKPEVKVKTTPVQKEASTNTENKKPSNNETTIPDAKDIFLLKERKVTNSSSTPTEPSKKVSTKADETDSKQVFMQICANYKKEYSTDAVVKIEKIKSSDLAEIIIDMNSITAASKNGIVLEFNNSLDAEFFNLTFKKPETLEKLKNILDEVPVIIALDKETVKEYKKEYLATKPKLSEPVLFTETKKSKIDDIIKKYSF